MSEYHKIQSVFKRDEATKHKTLLEGQWSLPEFGYLAANEWVFTEKVDGTNIRVIFNGAVVYGGRTDAAQIPATLVQKLNERFCTVEQRIRLEAIFPHASAVLYGEGYGAKIQKGGGNYRQDQDFVLFDVRVGEWWLQRADVEDIAEQLELDVVPIIGRGTLFDMVSAARTGITSQWGDFQAEGIVARPATELRSRAGHRLITKIKCRDFAP